MAKMPYLNILLKVEKGSLIQISSRMQWVFLVPRTTPPQNLLNIQPRSEFPV